MSATNELQTNRLDGSIDDGMDVAQKFSDFEAALRHIFGIPADTVMSEAMQIAAGGAVVMTGTLACDADITTDTQAATKAYVQLVGSGMALTRARAYLSSDGTTASSIYIPWDVADINENSVWNISNPTRLTIPVAGDYMVGFSLSADKVAAAAENRWSLDVMKNRTNAYNVTAQWRGETDEIGVSGLVYIHDLAVSDYLELKITLPDATDTTVYAANSTFWLFNLE